MKNTVRRRFRFDAGSRFFSTSLVLALLLTACSSPETKRVRGGGSGADVGNRRQNIEMHAGSRPYWQTPKLIGSESPPLETAQNARQGTQG
jgi:hypothetical protein